LKLRIRVRNCVIAVCGKHRQEKSETGQYLHKPEENPAKPME
jgi:hypothetical protein